MGKVRCLEQILSISDQKKVILIENNFLKELCAVFVFFICFAEPLFAQSYACKLKQNGYAHALNALGGSQNQKLEYAKAWMPEQFTVNANYLEFYNFEPLEITGGNRESDFQANFNTSKYRVSYKVHINKHTGSGKVYLSPQNYKRVGPALYTCIQTNTSTSETETSRNQVVTRPTSNGITDDMRYYLKVFSNETCINQISTWFRQNHEILAIIIGPGYIDNKVFRNSNSKQASFKNLASMNNRIIRSNHKNEIISLLDYGSSNFCKADFDQITDPILRGFLRSADESRETLIKKIRANNARYADVTLMLANESSQYDDIFTYWEAKDSEGMSKLANEMNRFLLAAQSMTESIMKTLQFHYDIN